MAFTQEQLDFINSPDTVDFLARRSDYLLDFIEKNPNILIAQTFMDRFVLGYFARENYSDIFNALGSGFVSSIPFVLGTLNREILDKSGIMQVHNQPYLNLKGRGVLVGIVDTGIDYTQPTFIYEDGTSKIQYIFDQSAIGTPPEGYTIGVEYTNEQINEALRSENPYDIVPERDTSGHGTFIASVAAGRQIGDFLGAAPDSEIIAVKLKKARPFYLERFCVPPWQEYAFESSAVMVGVEYILQKANELNRPVAICIGLGSNFGSHDGNSILEEYLSVVSNLKNVCLCVAAGNESQARHHTEGKITAVNETQNVDIRVGENAGNLCISIWNNVSDRLSVSVRSPSGELLGRIPPQMGVESFLSLVLETTTVAVQYFFPLEDTGGQLTIVRLLGATPGIWTIIVHGDIILDGSYHCWLPMTGFVSESVEFLSATPYYTITVPGTMIGGICCGAYNSFENSLYLNTSWGPTRAPVMAPDLVAPGVDVGGYFPFGYGTMSGTSCATAITTGAGALFLQWGAIEGNDVAIGTYEIRAYMIRGASRNPNLTYPNYQWGYGSLDMLNSFIAMRDQ